MRKLKPRTNKPSIIYVEAERREIATTDVTYVPMDMQLIKKYFPSIFKEIHKKKLVKKEKGSKG